VSTLAPHEQRLDDEYAERHVYEPHRVGLPPIGPYVRSLWKRRQFALQLSRTTLRAQHFETALGQLWLVINPLMLTLVYFLLVSILRHDSRGATYFAHLMAGLFAYHFVSQAVQQGAKSVTSSGRLILNTAFPRLLLPISSVITGFFRFLPTLGIYAIVHIACGLPIGLHLLWALPLMVLLVVVCTGITVLVAAAQVYFRDIASFLPYVMRIWMYASPVLWYASEVPDGASWLLWVNPLSPILRAWSDVLIVGTYPSAAEFAAGCAWAFGLLIVGCLFFMSREREFAVRI
jgi:teichoic acid transport system permease protein